MYERVKDRVATPRQFAMRVMRQGGYVLLAIAGALAIGMSGYHFINHLPWIDAFLESAMILGGMGPIHEPHTNAGKIFAGCYALFAGLFFIGATGLLLAPFLHRMIHLFHLEREGGKS